jgi:hypothetical protein
MKALICSFILINIWISGYSQALKMTQREVPLYDKTLALITQKKSASYPENIWVGEQLLTWLNSYLEGQKNNTEVDSLTQFINGDWSFIKVTNIKTLSPGWQKISTKEFKGLKKFANKRKTNEQDLFSPVLYSGDGNKAFLVYRFSRNNVFQSIMFYFFEKKNNIWELRSQQIPFLE